METNFFEIDRHRIFTSLRTYLSVTEFTFVVQNLLTDRQISNPLNVEMETTCPRRCHNVDYFFKSSCSKASNKKEKRKTS